ncbi:hypothetical protein [Microbulbifer spongiae]|uniref:Uncharacterized protein n=1 Tax=Microbulbifer spongiae TaxID=2944933 RepID=A0ABY9E9E9_9GAMM|nr:hypothetical protein [Microbulbifer sp. MI-G]WKD48757.1 hypothetical protein M8T91_12655 [Microbulbifer sp. MI-G]
MVVGNISGGLGDALSQTSLGVAGHYVASGLAGGAAAKALGGRFKDGFAGGLLSAGARHAMGHFDQKNYPGKEAALKDSKSPAAQEEANMKLAQKEFRTLYEKGVLPDEFNFIDNIEGGLDNKVLSLLILRSQGKSQKWIYTTTQGRQFLEVAPQHSRLL